MFRSALLLLGVLTLAAPAADAQETLENQAERIQAVQSQLDDRIVEWREADRRADIADSLRVASSGVSTVIDSTRIGPFIVATRESRTESLTAQAREAWAAFEPYLTGLSAEAQAALDGKVIGIYVDSRVQRVDGSVRIRAYYSEDERVRRIARIMDQQLSQFMPDEFQNWGRALGIATDSESGDEWTYRSLLTGGSKAGRECYDGDLTACWRAVGLLDYDRWWETWYAPHQLREVIRRNWSPNNHVSPDPGLLDRFTDCMDEGNDRSCYEIIEANTNPEVPNANLYPLSATSRSSLVATAIRLGGDGAYARLIDDQDRDIREHLAYVAGTSEDELIRTWREGVMEARPAVTRGAGGAAAATLGWIILLGAFATRSTRWRI